MLWVISELRFSTRESDEIASFVIEDFVRLVVICDGLVGAPLQG